MRKGKGILRIVVVLLLLTFFVSLSGLVNKNTYVRATTMDSCVTSRIQLAIDTTNIPIENAYWKDSIDGNIYSVSNIDGNVSVTKCEDISGLEDILPDRLLLWHDEFDANTIDSTKWSVGNCWGDKESRNDDAANSCYQIKNSILTLSARPSNPNDITQKWYSSAIISKQKLRQGYIQAKIKVVSNKYTNNAFWLNAPDPWPVSGEIDMFETHGDTQFEGALHFGNVDGNNGASSAKTYTSTKDWFIAGVEIDNVGIKLYQNNQFIGNMGDLNPENTKNWFAGINPYAFNPKSCIFDIAVNRPKTHESGDWESYIMVDYVRFYAPVTTEDLQDVTRINNISDFDIVIPGNRDVFFIDSDGKKKIQAHSKFLMNIDTEPHTELTGYSLKSSNEDIIRPCSQYGSIGFYSGKAGVVNLSITHDASGKSKVVTYEVAQNMNGKVECSGSQLGTVKAGDEKYWIADLSSIYTHKCVSNGRFQAEPGRKYTLSVSGGIFSWAYDSTYRYVAMTEYDENNQIVATTKFASNTGTITTSPRTASVQLSCAFTDGNNFAIRDYFDMMDALNYVDIR